MVKLTHGARLGVRVGDPAQHTFCGSALCRLGQLATGCSPSVLLMATALRSEGVPRGKDAILKRKPDGLVNF